MNDHKLHTINRRREQELLFDLEATLVDLINLYTLAWDDPQSANNIRSAKRWQTGVRNHFRQRTGWNQNMKNNALKTYRERKGEIYE